MYSGLFPIDLNYTVDKEVVGLTAKPELAAFTAVAAWVNFVCIHSGVKFAVW